MADLDLSEMNQLIVDMTAAPRELEGTVRVAVQKTAADIKADAQTFAPYEFGTLKNSITYETHVRAGGVDAEIGPTVEYGLYQELGTASMAPSAFMGPAFDRRAGDLDEALGQLMGGLL